MPRINKVILTLLLACTSISYGQAASPTVRINDADLAAAQRVLTGSAHAQAAVRACEPMLCDAGIDARYIAAIWEGGRFEILEGARVAIKNGQREVSERSVQAPAPAASLSMCRELLESDAPRGRRGIKGVAEQDIERMRTLYSNAVIDQNRSRDRSLYTDCMRTSFRSQQVAFETALAFCDCTLKAMQTVPDKELNEWFATAQRGTGAPMTQQSWFANLFPKLQACSATE